MLSAPHLIVIFIVALLVFGPEKLPELARTLGKAMAEFKRATADLRSSFEDHLRELERETRVAEIHKDIVDAATGVAAEPLAAVPELPTSATAAPSPPTALPETSCSASVSEKSTDGDAKPA